MYDISQGGPVIITPISFSGAGDNIVVPAVAGKPLNIFKLFLVVAGTTSLIFKNGTIALSGAIPLTANMSVVLDHDPLPWFTTTAGLAFIINSSNAVLVAGSIYYGVGK